MPFLANEHIDVPNKDILSWIFDDISYDWDKPVSDIRYYARDTWRCIYSSLADVYRCT